MQDPAKLRAILAFVTLALCACDESNGSTPAAHDAGAQAAGPSARERCLTALGVSPGATPLPPDQVDAGLVACDALSQTCAAGQKCISVRLRFDAPWPAPSCAPDTGELGKKEGEICFGGAGMDNCGAGLACFNMGTGEGVCAKLCDPCSTAPACAADKRCVVLSRSPAFALCMPRCNPAPCPADYIFECVPDPAGDYCDLMQRNGVH